MRTSILIALSASIAAQSFAQDQCAGTRRVPDLGYGLLTCHGCLTSVRRGNAYITQFKSEPAIYQIRADGPAAGRIQEGDTLVAVNGRPITDLAAGYYLATYSAADVALTLRRRGATVNVSITPKPVCPGPATEQAASQLDELGRSRLAQAAGKVRAGTMTSLEYAQLLGGYRLSDSAVRSLVHPMLDAHLITAQEYLRMLTVAEYTANLSADSVAMRASGLATARPGMLGVTVSCDSCSVELLKDGRARYTFADLPVITSVTPGSVAEQAGMQPGDVLSTIDGLSLAKPEGGARLGSLPASNHISLSWLRDGNPHYFTINFGTLPSFPSQFSQDVGTANVEVRGKGATWTTDPRTGALHIKIDSVEVIVKPKKS